MKSLSRERLLALLAAVIAATAGLTVVITDDDGDGRPDRIVVQKRAPQGDLVAAAEPGKAVTEPARSELRDETPPEVPQDDLREGRQVNNVFEDALRPPLPPVGAQNYEVQKDFSGHVYSDFVAGITPTEFCLHYTVSPNVPGWGDVYAIRDYFKRTRIASATFIADFEGHILQMVPLDHKSWTQGAFNPYCRASIEIIATGAETQAQWLASPLIRDRILSSLMRDVMRRYGLPLRFVDPIGCGAPPGYTDHNHIECGNDHTDVGQQFPFAALAAQLAESPCIARCKQEKVVRARDRSHRVTHERMRAEGCRARVHSRSVRDYRRAECRDLKRRDVRQRAGEKRARRKLAAL